MLLFLLLLALILTSTAFASSTTDPLVVVSLDKWNCGAGSYDQALSHQMAQDQCPTRMYEANLCCLAHDLCYGEAGTTQEECDGAFCYCLTRTVGRVGMMEGNDTTTAAAAADDDDGCTNLADSYCFMVQLFGSMAHSSAKDKSSPTTTTTAPPPSHNLTTDCNEDGDVISSCIDHLQKCTTTGAGECPSSFCSCIHQQQPNGVSPSCLASLSSICHPNSGGGGVHLWSVNINHFPAEDNDRDKDGSALMMVIGCLALAASIGLVVAYKVYKVCKNRKVSHTLPSSLEYGHHHQHPNYSRRHTFATLAVGDGYKPFSSSTSTDEDPSRKSSSSVAGAVAPPQHRRESIAHRLLHPHSHHHHLLLPMSASQNELITGDDGSSSGSGNSGSSSSIQQQQ